MLFNDAAAARSNCWFREVYPEARFLRLAMRVAPQMCGTLLYSVAISDEVTPSFLMASDAYAHARLFPPADKETVTAIATDGHEKVHAHDRGKCRSKPNTRGDGSAGRNASHGRFMRIDLASGRVLAVDPTAQHENNATVTMIVSKVLHLYPGPIALSTTGVAGAIHQCKTCLR